MNLLAELMNELQHQLNDVEAKEAILKNIADGDVYAQDSIGDTQLHLVLKNLQVNENVIKQILDIGARVNATNHSGKTPLHYALKYKNCELSIVRLLVDRGADVQVGDLFDQYPLFNAVENKRCPLDVIEFLLSRGASVHTLNSEGFNVLHSALYNKYSSLDVIKLLLDKGADLYAVNKYGEAALNVAVRLKRKDIVKMLLKKPKIKVNLSDKIGYTPLHRASSVLEIDLQNHPFLPKKVCPAIVKLLLEAGANVEKKTKNGLSALHLATFHHDTVIMKLLLEYGARVNIVCKNFMNPLLFAVSECNRVAMKCLLDAGALVFSDHPRRNFYPRLDCPFDQVSPLRGAVVRYDNKPSDENLQQVYLLLKYALLERPHIFFDIEMTDQTQELVENFEEQCLRELHSVCVKPNVTLKQFILGLRFPEDEECKTDEILEILNANVYPLYKEVLSGLLTRKELKERFERHVVYTVARVAKRKKNPKCVILNYDIACKVVKYLSDEDVLDLLLAFYKSNKKKSSPIDFSVPCNTLLEEIEVESERFFKRARIN